MIRAQPLGCPYVFILRSWKKWWNEDLIFIIINFTHQLIIMTAYFRKLPLTLKLMLIGIIPVSFLLIFSVMIFNEKSKTVKLIGDDIERMDQSSNLDGLIYELSRERRFTYQYLINKNEYWQLNNQRASTDSMMQILQASDDPALTGFTKFTFLYDLPRVRKQIDTVKNYPLNSMVQYYTDAIIRLSSLNSNLPAYSFLKPLYQDITAQSTLSKMVTFFGIIRTNIFNALYTKNYMTETILATRGTHKLFKSYEAEFLVKASENSVRSYNNKKKLTDYGTAAARLDTLFKRGEFDNTYNADEWWRLSSNAVEILRAQQINLWHSVDSRMKQIYQREKNTKNATFLFLLVAIFFVIIFITFSIRDINKLLRELKIAARKISRGGSQLDLKDMPAGVIGNLAKSIQQIDKNNLLLAEAASQIGKGNFDVTVQPRSKEDLLGISIQKMQQDLKDYASQKDQIQIETEQLVYRRDEFFSIASHELKTPITSLKAYTQLLLMDDGDMPSSEQMLRRMDRQIDKLTALINDLLDASKVESGQLLFYKQPFQLKQMAQKVVEETQSLSVDHQLTFQADSNAIVNADRERIEQVLRSFLSNALKYAPRSKDIDVAIYEKEAEIICSVRDFGNGIAPEEQHRIFDRFYRISGNNLNTFPGLGLGLFISKAIIEKHNGKIGVESEKGKGTVFYFSLPVFTA